MKSLLFRFFAWYMVPWRRKWHRECLARIEMLELELAIAGLEQSVKAKRAAAHKRDLERASLYGLHGSGAVAEALSQSSFTVVVRQPKNYTQIIRGITG